MIQSRGHYAARAAALRLRNQGWIDGRFVPAASGARFDNVTPGTGAVLTDVARAAFGAAAGGTGGRGGAAGRRAERRAGLRRRSRAGAWPPPGRHPDVDCPVFSGSTEAGKLFQRYAGESNMKQVWLETRGKSPNLIFADADLDAAAEKAAFGIFFDQGEVCSANSRMPVHDSIADEMIARMQAKAGAIALANDTVYGLAASVWARDLSRAMVVSGALVATTVSVNTVDALGAMPPFGGMKQSGFGRDPSLDSFDTYSALKTVWISY